jgi:hypothetical protein
LEEVQEMIAKKHLLKVAAKKKRLLKSYSY